MVFIHKKVVLWMINREYINKLGQWADNNK